MKSLTVSELAERLESGRATVLVDVRTPAEFDRLHAAGAVNVPLDELSVARLADAGLDGEIHLLCQSGTRAAKAAQILAGQGLSGTVVEGGTVAWTEAGLPVVRGASRVIGLERQVRLAAGSLVLLGVLLGFWLHPAAFGLSAFVGAGLVFAGATDWCGMALLLAKAPWNRAPRP